MVSSERLRKLKKALELDDILGKNKHDIISSIDKAIECYCDWEYKNTLSNVELLVKKILDQDKSVPIFMRKEALEVLVDLIDKDCVNNGINPAVLGSFNIDYLRSLIKRYPLTTYNKIICETSLQLRPYVETMHSNKKYKKYILLSEDEEDEEND